MDASANDRVAKALAIAKEVATDDMIARNADQLSLLPEGKALVEDVNKRHGPGRPKGALNLRVKELAKAIHSNLGNPVYELARLYGFATVEEIRRRDGVSAAEALKVKTAALAKVAEYTEQKMPVAVEIEGKMKLLRPSIHLTPADAADLGFEEDEIRALMARPVEGVTVIENEPAEPLDAEHNIE